MTFYQELQLDQIGSKRYLKKPYRSKRKKKAYRDFFPLCRYGNSKQTRRLQSPADFCYRHTDFRTAGSYFSANF